MPRKRFTRSEVERLLDTGFFAGQRYELIDGDLIDKMAQAPLHAAAIRLCLEMLAQLFGIKLLLCQMPIEAGPADSDRSVPEPDLAVLAALQPDFNRRHPSGKELTLLVEVADTTLRHDLVAKRDLYARAAVPEYWVLDLNGRRLLVHRDLDVKKSQYASIQSYAADETITLASHPAQPIAISSLLP